jgi:BirA family transcriptional regulator, biotin operon repressor / biotin---[acetyl-CoA-carboxylase] ligase
VPSDLNRYVIELALQGRFGRPFRYFDEIGSTNTEALEWSREGAPHGALVVTDHQTQGRGRLGRGWFSEPGTSLQLSLILRPVLPLDVFGLMSTALGLACAEAIEDLTPLRVSLKWPNDVMVGDRKVAGILVETRVAGHKVDVAVAGMGLNVSPPERWPDDLAGRTTTVATELASAGFDPHLDRSQLLAVLLGRIEALYPLVETGRGAAEIIRRAAGRSQVLGREVIVQPADGPRVRGVATRLLPSGALEIAAQAGHLSFHAGEIAGLRQISENSPGDISEPGCNGLSGSSTVER